MMKKILITGGSGFIGTHLVSHYLKEEEFILQSIDIKEPKITSHRPYWKCVDICDKEKLKETVLTFSPNYIIHLAARTDLRGKSQDDYNANILGVSNLLSILDKLPDLQRCIFTSSMYVCYPGYRPCNSNDYAPHTIYGESKVMTEKLIKEKNPSYTWCIIRPTSIWGPYFGEPYDKFFRIVLSHAYFHLGKKACKKTYGYIDNTIYQITALLKVDKKTVDKNIYYLGDYTPYDISEWADEIAAHENIKIPKIPFFLFYLAGKFGDILKHIGIIFPMTSFRLKNMTTDNIQNLRPIQRIVPSLPVSRQEGNAVTIQWIKKIKRS